MRIISHGETKAELPIIATCQRCDTVFEFAASEAQLVHDQREGDYLNIECPVCRSIVRKAASA